MGVPGLWDLIRHTGKVEALAQLALQGFRRDILTSPLQGLPKDTPHPRALRIGIDASIWFFHAGYGREGENPELRTLFFRLARLASFTFCPLFVFDGPQRPKTKRGKTINTRMSSLAPGMKNMISAFGFEWRTAPGEAEAELAYLNNIGVIDAILSDDVDNFLFGARVVIRNPSGTLSGNRSNPVLNKEGKDDGMHVMVYRAEDIEKDPACRLTRGGMILIGLLSGGDYDSGTKRCGPKTALALAQLGLGDELLDAFQTFTPERFTDFIPAWKEAVVEALRSGCATMDDGFEGEDEDEETQETAVTASQGEPISASQRSTTSVSASQQKSKGKKAAKAKGKKPPARRQPALAAEIAASDFPNLDVLSDYCAPWTSERAFAAGSSTSDPLGDDFIPASQGSVITSSQRSTASNSRSKKKASAALTVNSVGSGGLTSDVRIGWTGELALGALGRICEQYFEWGVREIIQQRFRTVLWPAVVLRVLRRSVMEQERIREQQSRSVTPRPSTPTRGSVEPIVPGTPRRLVKKHFGGGDADSDSGSDSDLGSGYVRSERRGDETPRARRTVSSDGNQVDPHQLLQAVKSEREHASTDGLREFRVEVAPKQLARLAVRELLGTRDPALLAGTMFDMEGTPKGDEDEEENDDGADEESIPRRLKTVDPATVVRVWVPAELVQMVHPELIRAWEERGTKSKSKAKATGSTARRKNTKDTEGGTTKKGGTSTKTKAKLKEKEKAKLPTTLSGDEIEEVPIPRAVTSRGSPPCEPPPKAVAKPQPASRSSDGLRTEGKETLSGSATEVESRPLSVELSKPVPKPKPKSATCPDTGSRAAKPSSSTRAKPLDPIRVSDSARERSSSATPALLPKPAGSTKTHSGATTAAPSEPKKVARIPGVVHVPSPPRALTRAGPASDSSELEDVTFRALLARPQKHFTPDSDSDSEASAGGKPKSPRLSCVQTSPRASHDKRPAVPRSTAARNPTSIRPTTPTRRPATRSQSSNESSEVEILDISLVRPLKHKAPEPDAKDRPAETGKVSRKSREQASPRASSASESEARPKDVAVKKVITRPGVPSASNSRAKAGSSSVRAKVLPKRLVDAVIDIASSSDDNVTVPALLAPKVSVRLGPATNRITRPPTMTRLDSGSSRPSSSRTKPPTSAKAKAADTSVIDLISD